jgi:hypothetical protein
MQQTTACMRASVRLAECARAAVPLELYSDDEDADEGGSVSKYSDGSEIIMFHTKVSAANLEKFGLANDDKAEVIEIIDKSSEI